MKRSLLSGSTSIILLTGIAVSAIAIIGFGSTPWWKDDFIVPPGIVRSGGYDIGPRHISGDTINNATNRAWCIGVTPELAGRHVPTISQAREYGRAMLKWADSGPGAARVRADMYSYSYNNWAWWVKNIGPNNNR